MDVDAAVLVLVLVFVFVLVLVSVVVSSCLSPSHLPVTGSMLTCVGANSRMNAMTCDGSDAMNGAVVVAVDVMRVGARSHGSVIRKRT